MALLNLPPIPERVTRGASLLDRLTPDWATRVDLELLDEKDDDRCVIAQVYGSCTTADEQLHQQVQDLNEAEYGFDRDGAERDEVYPELTTAWHAEITRRTSPTTPAPERG